MNFFSFEDQSTMTAVKALEVFVCCRTYICIFRYVPMWTTAAYRDSKNMNKQSNSKVNASAQCGGNTHTRSAFSAVIDQMLSWWHFFSPSWISVYHKTIEIDETLTTYTSYRSASRTLMFIMAHLTFQFCTSSHAHEHPLTEIITSITTWFMITISY